LPENWQNDFEAEELEKAIEGSIEKREEENKNE
jgi:hypothetical protein